jgi:ABC-type polysaccharide/polyol phosphate transport system ATPase subunit
VSATVRDQPPAAPSAGPSQAPAAVTLLNLSKGFKLPHERYHTLKERAMHPFKSKTFDVLQALDNVSLEVAQGEFFGIVGRNGSGKSTMLKCLAGIYEIDGGDLDVNGRLSPFLELGVGFNFDLTGRDNVIINAIMLGLSRKQALERFDAIVEFAELEEFIDLKLKNYSSGMQVRLAFAVAIQVDAEIMLIDEVLAVGDARFQQKCFDELARAKADGRTILFVTHDMGSVQRFCDRAMLLERGKVVDIGDPQLIARRYNELNFRQVRKQAEEVGGPDVFRREAVAEISDAVFESATGAVIVTAEQGQECCVRIDVRFHADTQNPIFGISLRNELGHPVFAANSAGDLVETGRFRAGELATVRFRFQNWLGPGRHRLAATVSREGFGADQFDIHVDSSLTVTATDAGGGAVDLPHTIEIVRG